jgi:hypothetical protein
MPKKTSKYPVDADRLREILKKETRVCQAVNQLGFPKEAHPYVLNVIKRLKDVEKVRRGVYKLSEKQPKDSE